MTLSLYDDLRAQARDLGTREIHFNMLWSTDLPHMTTADVVTEIENRYGPRDGAPEILDMSVVSMRGTGEYTERQVEIAEIRINVRAKINRFIFHGDPEKDRVDMIGVK